MIPVLSQSPPALVGFFAVVFAFSGSSYADQQGGKDIAALEKRVDQLEASLAGIEEDVERRIKVVEFKLNTLLKERKERSAALDAGIAATTVAASGECAAPRVSEKGGFRVEMNGCSIKDGRTLCGLLVTSLGVDRQFTLQPKNRAIDSDGNEYNAHYVGLGSNSGWSETATLPADIPLRGWVSFNKALGEDNSFAIMEINTSVGALKYKSVCLPQ